MNEYFVTSAVNLGDGNDLLEFHAPANDIQADIRQHQQVQVEVMFNKTRATTSVTRIGYFENEDWLFDYLISLVPFRQWQRVLVKATSDDVEDEINLELFDRISMQDDRYCPLNLLIVMQNFVKRECKNLLREDMLGVMDQADIDNGWEDRVPKRQWTFVIQ